MLYYFIFISIYRCVCIRFLLHSFIQGHADVVRTLLHAYADMEMVGAEGKTPLYVAVEKVGVVFLCAPPPNLRMGNIDLESFLKD